LAFNPDGTMLASGGWDNTVQLWDLRYQQRIGKPLTSHTGWVKSVAFNPDGLRLISGSDQIEDNILVWDVSYESWRERACAVVNRNLTEESWQRYVGTTYQPSCPVAGETVAAATN